MDAKRLQQKTFKKSMLYRVVFDAKGTRFAVVFLFAFFILHPTMPAFASESTNTEEEITQEVVEEVSEAQSESDNAEDTQSEAEAQSESDNAEDTQSVETEEEIEESEEDEETTEDETEDIFDGESTDALGNDVEEETEEGLGTQDDLGSEDISTEEIDTSDQTGDSESEETIVVSDADTASPTESVPGAVDVVEETAASSTEQIETEEDSSESDDDSDSEETATEESTGDTSSENEDTNTGTAATATPDVSTETDEADTSSQNETDTVPVEDTDNEDDNDKNDDFESEDSETVSSTSTAATTTDAQASSTPEIMYITSTAIDDSNRHQFAVDECVTVGDGSYYCSKANVVGEALDERTVFAAVDADGDREIFFNTGKKIIQITNNTTEDEAPEYDAQSHSIVWHRLVEGRYQIVQYDLDNERETILTDTRTNNMEPTREGIHTVWQRWVGDNWEIVLHDGNEEIIITNNQTHDLAPDIEGGYVIWHTNDMFGKRLVVVYEIETELLSYIEDSDGGQVVNPRFVLVYDTKFDNGDSITKGFDPETGALVPLSAQPGERPVDIPDSDPTGETRALINSKVNSRDDTLEELVPEPDLSSSTPEFTNTASSTLASDTETVDLSTTTPAVSENLPLTDFDIIVEPYEATSTQSSNGTSTQDIVE